MDVHGRLRVRGAWWMPFLVQHEWLSTRSSTSNSKVSFFNKSLLTYDDAQSSAETPFTAAEKGFTNLKPLTPGSPLSCYIIGSR